MSSGVQGLLAVQNGQVSIVPVGLIWFKHMHLYFSCVLFAYCRDLMAKEDFRKLGYHNEQTNEGS